MRAVGICVLALALTACGEQEPTPYPVVEATIDDIQSAIRDGRTTCRAVVEAHLARIEAYDKATGLGAITVLNPKALSKADALDARLKASEQVGSLFCVPLLVKDNFDTADMVTSGGSAGLANNFPPDDAFMVRKLREADAIIVAKTNMAEWAFSARYTESSSFGITANAYARARVPAGSSGGTASGVAASFAIAGLGSDTGNSIRGPSSRLALFGIRSTIGLTSRDGVIPLAFDRDIAGPMTRTVRDGAMLFNVVAGYDPADPYTELGRGRREADYTAFLKADGLQGARLAVLDALTYTEDADSEITALFDMALADLAAAGATVVMNFEIPNLAAHRDNDSNFCQRFRYDMHEYLLSLGDKAPFLDVIDMLEAGTFAEDARPGLEHFADYPLDVHPRDWETPCPDFADHPGRQAFLADVLAAMDAAGVDAILYPSWTSPPALITRQREDYRGDNSQEVAPATGLPAVTVPMGFSHGNLPAGLQILARPYAEGLLIQYAYAFEQATLHRRPPADYPELGE